MSEQNKALIRRWFEEVLITPARTRGTAFRGESTTEGMPNIAVDALEEAHAQP